MSYCMTDTCSATADYELLLGGDLTLSCRDHVRSRLTYTGFNSLLLIEGARKVYYTPDYRTPCFAHACEIDDEVYWFATLSMQGEYGIVAVALCEDHKRHRPYLQGKVLIAQISDRGWV